MPKINKTISINVLILSLILGIGFVVQARAQTTAILSENFDDGQYCFQGYTQKQECLIPSPAGPAGWYSQDYWWKLGRVCDNIYRGTGNWANSAFQGDPWSAPSILATKALNLEAGTNYTLKFYARVAGSCIYGNGRMYLSVFTSASQFSTGTQIGSIFSLNTSWSQKIINFTVPSSGTYYIQFQASRGGDGVDYTIIDDILITGTAAPLDFSLSRTPSSGAVIQGASIQTAITASLTSGSSQSVSFSASNLPTGATAVFSPTSCSPTCSSVLTINTLATTPAGTKTITITAVGGALTKTTSYSLTVSAAASIFTPTVSTNSVSSITASSATLDGNITNIGGATVTAKGFQYGLSQTPTWTVNQSGSFSTGAYMLSVTSLSQNTKYYFRAYATNSVGTNYGSWLSFTTTGEEETITVPTVTTNSATSITTTSATLNGNVSSTGGASVLERGFDWGTISGSLANDLTQTGTYGTGSFTRSLTGLTPGTEYYYRAKARNSAGWDYGSQMSFTASVSPLSFSLSCSSSSGTVNQGQSVQITVNTSLTSGISQSVSFSVTNLPIGATAVFSPTSCSPTCSSILTINTSNSTPISSKTITISADGGTLTKTTSYYLKVAAAGEEETITFPLSPPTQPLQSPLHQPLLMAMLVLPEEQACWKEDLTGVQFLDLLPMI